MRAAPWMWAVWPGAVARTVCRRSRVIRRPVSAVRTRAGSTGRRARVRWSMTALRCLVSLNREHSLALIGQGATQGPQVLRVDARVVAFQVLPEQAAQGGGQVDQRRVVELRGLFGEVGREEAPHRRRLDLVLVDELGRAKLAGHPEGLES